MHQSALYDPIRSATPSQRLAAAAHRERMFRFSGAAISKPAPTVAALPPPPEPTAPPIPNAMMALAHDQIERSKRPLTRVQEIQRAVLAHYPNVVLRDVLSHRRTAEVVLPRQLAMYMVKKLTLLSLPAVGRRFGGRDHTTVLHAVQKIGRLIKQDPVLAAQVADIEASLSKDIDDGE